MKPIQFKRKRLLLIFILALIVSIALGKILPVSTQTPSTSTPCKQLEEDIKTEAKKDAESDRFRS
jgi:hypothetical protein